MRQEALREPPGCVSREHARRYRIPPHPCERLREVATLAVDETLLDMGRLRRERKDFRSRMITMTSGDE